MRSHAQCAPLPPRAFARGGEGSGGASAGSGQHESDNSAGTSASVYAAPPPTPDLESELCSPRTPPLRGRRGATIAFALACCSTIEFQSVVTSHQQIDQMWNQRNVSRRHRVVAQLVGADPGEVLAL